MNKFLFLLLFPFCVFAQQDSISYKYWVSFTDKDNSNFDLNMPEGFLSQRAIDRRVNQGIDIKIQDLPINSWYADSIGDLGFDIINRSKWFNGIMITTNDSTLVNQITFPFVKSVLYLSNSALELVKMNSEFFTLPCALLRLCSFGTTFI